MANKKDDPKKNDSKKDDSKKDDSKKNDFKNNDSKKNDFKKNDSKKDDSKKNDSKKNDSKKDDPKRKKEDEDEDNKQDDNDNNKINKIIIVIENNDICFFCNDPNCDNNCSYKNDFYDYEESLRMEEERRLREELRMENDYEDRNDNPNKNKNNKRKGDDDPMFYDDQNPLNLIFKNYANETNKRNKKSKNNNEINDFYSYFKEADKLTPINKEIKNLKDLIELGKTYDKNDSNRYVINLRSLNKCVKPLEELDNMIGMKNIKEMIIDLIFFRLQNFEDKKEELWHLVIEGTPGSGKTEVAKIIGKLYFGLGITKKDKFTPVKRSDLIGKYLGHTAKMTQNVFDDAKGGILFIDEAYSLGNPEQRDSFSKECIDTINQNLTENRETVVFIAGYKEQLNESFFSYNPGLNRRFKMRLSVDKYNATDLRDIFIKKIRENEWNILNDNIDKEIPIFFFEKNIKLFKYNGGDMENLWHLTKIVHARRVFGKPIEVLKKITNEDLENSLKLYSQNDEVKNRNNESLSEYLANTMYS